MRMTKMVADAPQGSCVVSAVKRRQTALMYHTVKVSVEGQILIHLVLR
jgi:hypothetical protein